MKIGIYGYGNLGRGVETAVWHNPDMETAAVFTRRDPKDVQTYGAPVYSADQATDFKDKIDVMIICGGSATDLPEMTPMLAKNFNIVDSFDTHAKIPEHFAKTDKAAKDSGHIALICAGWDPGLFSLARLYFSSVMPVCTTYTFWGKGVSQGHSDAIRRIEGVTNARQYTLPVPEALERVRAGENPTFTPREKHRRDCYVSVAEGADKERIKHEIITMPAYFADYDTTVTFVSEDEIIKNHSALPHGGHVLCSCRTGQHNENLQKAEFTLSLESNPEFTASVITAGARAMHKMHARGITGCKTMLDIPPADLSALSDEELRKSLL
ncbi:MAG: diaminopimelate dehydrogenase [Synergistes sp.]|nr:diaminopimelate dehydrogenase [Synergistes sp.]